MDDPSDSENRSTDDLEALIRRVVREEVRAAVQEEVRPLREKLERLERSRTEGPAPRRDLPEDPHDFGLIAEADEAKGRHT